MEQQKDTFRFSMPLLLFTLCGLGISAVFVFFSASDPFLESDKVLPTTVAVINGQSSSSGVSGVNIGGQVSIGQLAPNFTLQSLNGDDISLSDYSGHPVLINFWATWCAPYRQEMPELVRSYNEYQNKGFVILAVNLSYQDSVEDVQTFAEEFEMPFPILLDEEGEVSAELYQLLGLPMSVFIDRKGRIVRTYIGLMLPDQIDGFVNEILEKEK